MAKLKLNETQLHDLTKAFYRAELAALELKDRIADKQVILERVQKESNSTFQTWNTVTGETDFEISPEVYKPAKRAKTK